jgi:drug/metabolite transporter (DMT)-like permease
MNTTETAIRSQRPTFLSRLWNAPYSLLALAALFWAGNFVVGRALNHSILPIALAFWRWTASLAILLPFAWRHRSRDLPLLIRHWPNVTILGLLGIAVYNSLIYVGLGSTTAINALLMQSLLPVFIPFCAFCAFRERPRGKQVAGLTFSLVGIAVVAGRGSLGTLQDLHFEPGDIWTLLAVLAYALYSVALRKRPLVHPSSLLAASVAVGVMLLLPVYLFERATIETTTSHPLDAEAVLGIGYLAVFASALAYLCFNRCVELIGANRAGMGIHLMPAFGSVLAVLFLGERLHLFHLAGLGFIATGIALTMP